MAMASKFFGNIAGMPVGSPDDKPWVDEYFPDGQYNRGFVRRGLPSEMALDQMINPPLQGRENGYFSQATGPEIDAAAKENQKQRRAFRLTVGNTIGRFTGPPDRSR